MSAQDRAGVLAPQSDFPLLSRRVHGRPIIYLDNAATTLKPHAVLEAMNEYHTMYSGNVFRGNHLLAEEASDAYDGARTAIADFMGADPLELTFWLNATDAINAVAHGLRLERSDRVIAPVSEHHSNFVSWLNHATVDVVGVDDDGFVDPDDVRRLVAQTPRPRIVAVGHASNVTGAVQPVERIGEICREYEVPYLIDGAQGAPHLPIDLEALGCNYYAFSGHKMLGPTGVGVLWGDYDSMAALHPVRAGGGMVMRVHSDRFEIKDPPHGFEAGTPNVAGVIGLGAAARYLMDLSPEAAAAHERRLSERMLERVGQNPALRLLGPKTADSRISLVSTLVDGAQSADHLSFKLSDRYNVMTRSGTHCAQPFFNEIGAPTSIRFSAYVYTALDEIDTTFDAIDEVLH